MIDKIYAPWTDEIVENLNKFQTSRLYHSFTCGISSSHGLGHLWATHEGWRCTDPTCDYTQNWTFAGLEELGSRIGNNVPTIEQIFGFIQNKEEGE